MLVARPHHYGLCACRRHLDCGHPEHQENHPATLAQAKEDGYYGQFFWLTAVAKWPTTIAASENNVEFGEQERQFHRRSYPGPEILRNVIEPELYNSL